MTRATLIYDGTCQFCRRGMQWFAARDRGGNLAFVARDSDEQRARFPQISAPQYAGAMQCLDDRGAIHSGHAAIALALRTLPQWHYRVAGWLLDCALVRPFARLGYKALAKYRQRIKCDDGGCKI